MKEAIIRGDVGKVKELIHSDKHLKQQLKENTFVHLAARHNNTEVIEELFEHGANLAIKDHRGRTALHIAAEYGNINALKCLLEIKNKASTKMWNLITWQENLHIDDKDNEGKTALHYASENKRKIPSEVILIISKLLVEAGCKIIIRDNNQSTPLHYSCMANNEKLFQFLFETHKKKHKSKFNINSENSDGRTCLSFVVENGNEQLAKFLLDEGAIIIDSKGQAIVDNKGNSILHYAAIGQNEALVKYIVNCTPKDVRNAKNNDGNTAMHIAATKGNIEIVSILFKRNCIPNIRNILGELPIHKAAAQGNAAVVEFMLGNKIAVTEADNRGNTILHLAALHGHYEIVKMIVNKDNVNLQNSKRNTPLHLAVMHGKRNTHKLSSINDNDIESDNKKLKDYFEIVKLLISKGAEVRAENAYDQQPLSIAIINSSHEEIKLIQSKFADVNDTDLNNNSALYNAVLGLQTGIVADLIKRGANANYANKSGITPLHAAVAKAANIDNFEDAYKIIGKLISHVVDIDAVDKNGRTALHYAADQLMPLQTKDDIAKAKAILEKKDNSVEGEKARRNIDKLENNKKLIKFLIENGAKRDIKDNSNKTPYDLANNDEIKECLTQQKEPDYIQRRTTKTTSFFNNLYVLIISTSYKLIGDLIHYFKERYYPAPHMNEIEIKEIDEQDVPEIIPSLEQLIREKQLPNERDEDREEIITKYRELVEYSKLKQEQCITM
jgi:serine/threonine-protein phosphatase 6 regulatory ankyrin repeat subunit A/serine/threonine-protein phosphatase 6 regulatory ankyrin repeat subunit B